MTTSSPGDPFAERYCTFHRIAPEEYSAHLLQHSLHAPLRWVWPLIRGLCRYHFQEDRFCIDTVGRLRSLRAAKSEMREFSIHPTNRVFSRRILLLRLSTTRLERALKALPQTEKRAQTRLKKQTI
mgnify:CR=1 FL=1